MRERLTSAAAPRAWPASQDWPATQVPAQPGEQEGYPPPAAACPHTAEVTSVIEITGDARRLTLSAVGLLVTDLIGAAVVVSALFARGHLAGLGPVGLLLPVMLGWIVTAVLVLAAEWPVAYAFGQLRWSTGAPVDPSAPWSPLGVLPLPDSAVTWNHVVPLIAATTLRQTRARRALISAVITTAAFFSWMALALAVAALA
jgi:hypothetical protein